MRRLPLFLWSLVLGIIFACLFGILFDLYSVRNSPAYFTIGHPRRPEFAPDPFTDPTMAALFWGVFATWWLGAGLGFIHGLWLMLVDRRISLMGLFMRHVYLLGFMMLVGFTAFGLGQAIMDSFSIQPQHVVGQALLGQLNNLAEIKAFVVNAVAHSAAYLSAGLAAIFLFGYALAHGRFAQR